MNVVVVGAGILGLWQALTLARAGASVRLVDAAPRPFAAGASQYAGAMIAPYCEAEAAPDLVRANGIRAGRLWRETLPSLVRNGSLVVAMPRDQAELRRFADMTTGHQRLDAAGLTRLEPELGDRFQQALYFPDEAHMTTPDAMRELLSLVQSSGGQVALGVEWDPVAATDGAARPDAPDWTIDCRGMAARAEIASLRGVRGERILLSAPTIGLARPVRLLHPRHPLYVVPWTMHRFLVGATVIESEDDSAMTVRSALELLGLAYALHPGFAEAEILDMGAGVRPALPDNVPRVFVDAVARVIRVNGAYRHGFLLAPVLAAAVKSVLFDNDDTSPFIDRRKATS